MRPRWLTLMPIAHRGLYDAADHPENSLPAFQRAVSCGIPFECDVQLTGDGQLVVIHDANLERLAGEPVRVADLDRRSLQRLRVGPAGVRIPTLAEVLEVASGRVPFVIDVRRWRGDLSADLERAVATQIRGYGGPFALQSFDPLAVFRLHRLVQDRPVGQVSGKLRSAGRAVSAMGRTMVTNVITRPAFISYELSELPSAAASSWRRLGIPLLAWTVCSAEDEERAAEFADNFFFGQYLPRTYQKGPPPETL